MNTSIHPSDDMVNPTEPDRYSHYFNVGREALGLIRSHLTCEPGSILDLPCGYGRVLRWIRAEWPDVELTACDINREMIDFCAHRFRAKPVYSPGRLDWVDIGQHDLVWSGSLLNHLPDWSDFLAAFRNALNYGGRLIFTTHGDRGRDFADKGGYGVPGEALVSSYDTEGFSHVDYPGQSGYGISLSHPSWVREQLATVGLQLVDYMPAGWDNHQDVWCTSRIV